jgi:hypothetical protein
MTTIKVFTATEALAAVEVPNTRAFTIVKKKEDKVYKGTRFLNVFWSIGREVKKEGWFRAGLDKNNDKLNEPIILSVGVADPADAGDKRNDFKGTRMVLQTTVSRSGDMGKFLLALNPQWKAAVDDLVKDGTIVIGTRKIHDMVQTHVAESNEKAAGEVIEDPIIRFKIDFGLYPSTYRPAFLAGRPRTVIEDYRTAYIDSKGIERYHPAMVEDPVTGKPVPVNEDNLHLFLTEGTIVHSYRVSMPSASISREWVSMPMTMAHIVATPGAPGGFSDEVAATPHRAPVVTPTVDGADNAPVVATPETVTTTPVTPPVTTTTVRNEEPDPAHDEEIDALLLNI